jgi:hypothetical protein
MVQLAVLLHSILDLCCFLLHSEDFFLGLCFRLALDLGFAFTISTLLCLGSLSGDEVGVLDRQHGRLYARD